jgi:hypothetical protein
MGSVLCITGQTVRGTGQTGVVQNWANGLKCQSQQLGVTRYETLMNYKHSYTYMCKAHEEKGLRVGQPPPVRPVQAIRPKSWVLTMCTTKSYGSICMYSMGSQMLFYQRKFKSLHGIKRSGNTEIWIPFERRTRGELQELGGESVEGPWESIFHPILSLVFGWFLRNPWGKREVEEG